jgi:anti-sigma-K factor RskA
MSHTDDHSGAAGAGLPEDELRAAEYALGVLAGPERAEAENRVAREPAFAARVAAWEERLSPWAGEIAEVEPPPYVWNRIAAALPAPAAARAGLWQSLAFWRGLALAGGVVAAACIAALVYVGSVGRPAPLVAALDGGGRHVFVATVDPRRSSVLVVPAAFAAAAGKVPELWLIPPGEKPRAVGLLDASKPVALRLPAKLLAQAAARAVLAVSLEPPGGSPTGQPTGPVIATGTLTKL